MCVTYIFADSLPRGKQDAGGSMFPIVSRQSTSPRAQKQIRAAGRNKGPGTSLAKGRAP